VFLARVYGCSWLVAVGWALLVAGVGILVRRVLTTPVPVPVPEPIGAVALGLVAGVVGKRAAVRLGGLYLRWLANARRADIERTLPGAVRYLHVLASGSDGPRAMLQRVAATGAYGETAVALRTVLNTASLTGSLGEGLRRVARDTPSRELLAPFLLKFREHADQGDRELRDNHKQDRTPGRVQDIRAIRVMGGCSMWRCHRFMSKWF
jgi:hypothetical protein